MNLNTQKINSEFRHNDFDISAFNNLEKVIQTDIDNGNIFGASILVAKAGNIGYCKTFGQVAPGRKTSLDDRFLMMSLSKSFTAALTLRAIDQGRYTLDTRVADIIPGFAAGGKERITVHQLLTHTAGTYPGFAPPPPVAPLELGDLAKNAQAVCAQPAAYTPGTRVVYNPFASYAILGQLLVKTDPKQRPYHVIAREELFEPLGMNNMSYGLPVDHPLRVPVSFTEKNKTPATDNMELLMNKGLDEHSEHPAGGAFGTIHDVFKFTEVLRQRGNNGKFKLYSRSMFDYASQNHTGSMSNGAWDSYREEHGLPDYPANFSLLGGYVRGNGHFMTGAGVTASPDTFYAVGGGSTMWLVDPVRDITVIFLSAGFIEGLAHFQRLCRINDLAFSACS